MATNAERRLREVESKLSAQRLVDVAYPVFVKNTPIDSGKARRQTEKHQDSIVANYEYAQVLEKGRGFRDGQLRGSNQAPKGMSTPTIDYLRQYIKRTLGR